MKKLIIDNDNIKEERIDEEVTRVKALIVNDKNEILLVNCYNEYQLPGGHLEENETPEDGLIREIKEETGANTKIEDYSPFMVIKDYTRNYRETNKNRCNKIIYYVLNKDYDISLANSSFSDYEKKGDFRLELVHLDKVEDLLIESSKNNSFAKIIAIEMICVLKEYKNEYRRIWLNDDRRKIKINK